MHKLVYETSEEKLLSLQFIAVSMRTNIVILFQLEMNILYLHQFENAYFNSV